MWNSPYINHFLSPDSIIPDQTNPQSWDRYAYTFNNPLRYSDPSGHCPICIGLVLVGALFIFNGTNDSYQPNLSAAELESRQASVNIGTSLIVSSYAIQYPLVEAVSNIYDCTQGFCDPSLMLPGSVSTYNNALEEGTELAEKEGIEEATELTIQKPTFVKDANTFASWIKTIEHDRPNLTRADVDFLVNEADNYGVEVDAALDDLIGHTGTNWPDPHIHFGQDRKFHIPVPKGYQLPKKDG